MKNLILIFLTLLVMGFVSYESDEGEFRIFGNTQEIASKTITPINFHTEYFDTLDVFDVSQSQTELLFSSDTTCLIHARVWIKKLSMGDMGYIEIRFNDVAYAGDNIFMGAIEGSAILDAFTTYQFSAGDYVQVNIYHNSDTPKQINSNIIEAVCN